MPVSEIPPLFWMVIFFSCLSSAFPWCLICPYKGIAINILPICPLRFLYPTIRQTERCQIIFHVSLWHQTLWPYNEFLYQPVKTIWKIKNPHKISADFLLHIRNSYINVHREKVQLLFPSETVSAKLTISFAFFSEKRIFHVNRFLK